MAKPPQDSAARNGTRATPRDARLKAALQANIARRKAQARVLSVGGLCGAQDTGPDAVPDRTEPGEASPHFNQDLSGALAPHDPSQKD